MTSVGHKKIIQPLIKMDNNYFDCNHDNFYNYIKRIKPHNGNKLISIILPVFNEEKSIQKVVKSLPYNELIEIITVDDCSTDGSVEKIVELMKEREIVLVRHTKNKGYGGAITSGAKKARGDYIVTMDSDGQHCPDDIINLIRPIIQGKADYTIGSRYLGLNLYNLPLKTRVGEAIVEKIIHLLFRVKIMNNQNGFRAFNRKILYLFDDIKYEGYTFCTEMILKTIMFGHTIKECPITVLDREHGASHIKIVNLTLNVFSCIFRYLLKRIRLHLIGQKYRRNK